MKLKDITILKEMEQGSKVVLPNFTRKELEVFELTIKGQICKHNIRNNTDKQFFCRKYNKSNSLYLRRIK